MGNYADLLRAQNEAKPHKNPETLVPRKQATKEPGNQGSQEASEQGNKEAGKQGIVMPAAEATTQDGRFDLNERAEKDATFQFAERELDALDLLCIELKRELGEKPKKYDIIRAGLQHMIEDYHARREKSIIIERLRRRK